MAYPFYQNVYQPYGNYYPASYQPVVPAQMAQAPQAQPQTQPQQLTPQNQSATPSGRIWVSGEREASMFPVAPNSAVDLWETSGQVIYTKQADATGKPAIRVYDLVERTETASVAQSPQDVKMPDYATKEDVATLAGAVKSILGDMEQMKSDLYGVAGRKKTAKKTEALEDDA